jgi:hypothetical protein
MRSVDRMNRNAGGAASKASLCGGTCPVSFPHVIADLRKLWINLAMTRSRPAGPGGQSDVRELPGDAIMAAPGFGGSNP